MATAPRLGGASWLSSALDALVFFTLGIVASYGALTVSQQSSPSAKRDGHWRAAVIAQSLSVVHRAGFQHGDSRAAGSVTEHPRSQAITTSTSIGTNTELLLQKELEQQRWAAYMRLVESLHLDMSFIKCGEMHKRYQKEHHKLMERSTGQPTTLPPALQTEQQQKQQRQQHSDLQQQQQQLPRQQQQQQQPWLVEKQVEGHGAEQRQQQHVSQQPLQQQVVKRVPNQSKPLGPQNQTGQELKQRWNGQVQRLHTLHNELQQQLQQRQQQQQGMQQNRERTDQQRRRQKQRKDIKFQRLQKRPEKYRTPQQAQQRAGEEKDSWQQQQEQQPQQLLKQAQGQLRQEVERLTRHAVNQVQENLPRQQQTQHTQQQQQQQPRPKNQPQLPKPYAVSPVDVQSAAPTDRSDAMQNYFVPEENDGGARVRRRRRRAQQPSERRQTRIAVVVPYRNRQEQLSAFAPALRAFLSRQDVFAEIFVVEQLGKASFNRGALINIGFLEANALSVDRDTFDCVVVHDIDLIPLDLRNRYDCLRPAVARAQATGLDGGTAAGAAAATATAVTATAAAAAAAAAPAASVGGGDHNNSGKKFVAAVAPGTSHGAAAVAPVAGLASDGTFRARYSNGVSAKSAMHNSVDGADAPGLSPRNPASSSSLPVVAPASRLSDLPPQPQPAVQLSSAIDKMNWSLIPAADGGVNMLASSTFRKVNGFSNRFFGWGGEDNDLTTRLGAKNVVMARRNTEHGCYANLKSGHYVSGQVAENRFDLLRISNELLGEGLTTAKYRVLGRRRYQHAGFVKISVDIWLHEPSLQDGMPWQQGD